MSELTVTKSFRVRRDRHGRKRLKAGAEVQSESIPRIARLLALAIRFDGLIRKGVVADQAELARRGLVSRARLTQIMDLLLLAPAIQESLLRLETDRMTRAITERQLRKICGFTSWAAQLALWRFNLQI